MTSKIQEQHTRRPAYIYLRQSTMGRVYHHRESTERQYALKEKALQLGWTADNVKILDRDLGISGTEYMAREDFRMLVADVSMNEVGAVFALEASRLSRSCADWHRLLELCSLSSSLIIDEDGCYDPSDFNDRLLKNPSYAGAYAYGRYKSRKWATERGDIQSRIVRQPISSWQVLIKEHHESYITWEEYLENQTMLEQNRTNTMQSMIPGPAREGMALLQGILICGTCGRRLTVRYTGNGGIFPTYQCTWRHRDGLSGTYCMSIRCNLIDGVIAGRVLQVTRPAQMEIALEALQELELRDAHIDKQWQMRIERANYSAQLAQRRYEEVDPANRLVAATLEKKWNDALAELEQYRQQYARQQQEFGIAVTDRQKQNIVSIAQNLPRLWNAPSTNSADRKRIIRLLIKDITVEKPKKARIVILHIRWNGGATEDITVDIPLPAYAMYQCSRQIIDEVRILAKTNPDHMIADILNRKGLRAPKGGPFTTSSVRWMRYKYHIISLQPAEHEITVEKLMDMFSVSRHVVYYWIERGIVKARQLTPGSPYWITITTQDHKRLQNRVSQSSRIPNVNKRSVL